MKIFIMRHGEAASIAGEDSLRPLTKQGALEAEKMGQWLARSKPVMMNVFVSPYIRAQQTCAYITDALTKASLMDDAELNTLDFITPSGNARHLHDYLDGLLQSNAFSMHDHCFNDDQAILFVSHMPFVSYLVGELTGSSNMPIFSTGAIAVIDYDIKLMQGQLVAMVSPDEVQI